MDSINAKELLEVYQLYLKQNSILSRTYVKAAKSFLIRQKPGYRLSSTVEGLNPTQKITLKYFIRFVNDRSLAGAELINNLSQQRNPKHALVDLFFKHNHEVNETETNISLINRRVYELVDLEKNGATEQMEDFVKNSILNDKSSFRLLLFRKFVTWIVSSQECRELVNKTFKLINIDELNVKLNPFIETPLERRIPVIEELKGMVSSIPTIEGRLLVALMVLDGIPDQEIVLLKKTNDKGVNSKYSEVTIELMSQYHSEVKVELDELLFPRISRKQINTFVRLGLDNIGRSELLSKTLVDELRKVNFYKSIIDTSNIKTKESKKGKLQKMNQ